MTKERLRGVIPHSTNTAVNYSYTLRRVWCAASYDLRPRVPARGADGLNCSGGGMTVRNLDYLLKPKSIALIGASRKPKTIGSTVARNLFNAGFDGPIMPVSAQDRSIEGPVLRFSRSAADYPRPRGDLYPARDGTRPDPATGRARHQSRHRHLRRLRELGPEGKALEQQVLDAARPHLLRVPAPTVWVSWCRAAG